MERNVQPELLDRLAAHEPAARHSRRDLRLINAAMGNHRWLQRTLARITQPGDRLLELGAGTGELARVWTGSRCDALDLQPAPPSWPAGAHWHQADVQEFVGWPDYNVVFGNLFFHHLDDASLAAVGAEIRDHAEVIVACEPLRRRRFAWMFAALCPLIGANHVTRHDGRVSIDAGFRGDELPRKLGLLDSPRWNCTVRHTWRGGYHFTGTRR